MSDPDHQARLARLRELLSIPDRERSDAQWDELNELEIVLASSNRQGAPRPEQQGGGQNRPRHGGGGQHPGGQGRKFHNRPPKRRGPPPGR
ncbi:MAG: hypothetical protein OEZ09_02070 [Betaproteobacteria bacterium]|nr:hypothetical protein [Betaproteobacteria bacterium]MDH4325360.1 hypothetical protein [Betaproteobacteria bacterium]MDH5211955.1 hypothetical protein [Betaproteobacteria bacterium]MDH5577219.1 hypothetical protein [Betaproteobacteria bacterium]